MGGGKGGGKGGGINVSPSPYEQSMANIANQYYSQTQPLRNYFLEDFGGFLRPGGGTSYNMSPTGAYSSTYGIGATPTPTTTPMSQNFLTPSYVQGSWNEIQAPSASRLPSPTMINSTDALPSANPAYYQGLQDILNYQGSQLANMQKQIASGAGTTQAGAGGYGGMASSAKYNPYNLPGYAPLYQLARGGVESQYNQARANILGSTPRGGALGENLSNLEMSRAQAAGSLPAQIATPLIQDIMNKAYGSAFGAPSQAMAGLGGAASAYTGTQQAALAQAAQAQQASMGLGAGLGSLAGLGIKAAMK